MIPEIVGAWKALTIFPGVQQAVGLCGAYMIGELAIKAYFKGGKSATGELGNTLGEYKGVHGFMLTKAHQLSFRYSCYGVVIVGPPGSAKTACFIKTNMLCDIFPKNTSFVAADMKGDIANDTIAYQTSLGKRCIIFAPLKHIGHYNPLEWCDTFTDVRNLATILLTNGTLQARLQTGGSGLGGSESTWIAMSTAYLTSSLWFHKQLKKEICTIAQALRFLIDNKDNEIEELYEQLGDKQVLEQWHIYKTSEASGGTTGSIRGTMSNYLGIFLDPAIVEFTSKSDISPLQLRDEKIGLYIQYTSSEASYLSPLMSIIYSQLIEKSMKYYDSKKNNIVWYLDEANNLGKIANLSNIVNTCKEYGMAFMLCVQSISKLYEIYGKNDSQSILGATQTKCVLPGLSDIESLQYFSTLCGPTEVLVKENNKLHKVKKSLFEKDELKRLKSDKVVIIPPNLNPILATKQYYFKDKNMVSNQYLLNQEGIKC